MEYTLSKKIFVFSLYCAEEYQYLYQMKLTTSNSIGKLSCKKIKIFPQIIIFSVNHYSKY